MITEIIQKIITIYKDFARKIRALVDGDETIFSPYEHTESNSIKDPNETVLVSDWELEIRDKNGNSVYHNQLLFNKENDDDPNLSKIKIIGRSDPQYYRNHGIDFDPSYDIAIKREWKGADKVHRLHAYLVHNKNDGSISLNKFPNALNGLYDEDGNEFDTTIIEDGMRVRLGTSMIMIFTKPGKILVGNETWTKPNVHDKSDEKEEPSIDYSKNPRRIPGRGNKK